MVKVSFVVIAYNEARNISRCISSILAQEDLGDFELIVVDDGSKDNTATIVTQLQEGNSNIKLTRLVPNQGRGGARAAGIHMAVGEYIAFIDADIVLPEDWVKICLGYMKEYDAVGGIAVPDGDVNYIYGLFNLEPKKVHHSTVITGSNGLYKRQIFDRLNFDSSRRDGEDIVFNHLMTAHAFRTRSIESLVVIHKESKSFKAALTWLYQSGMGAARQFKQFNKVRFPDVVFVMFVLTSLTSVVLALSLRHYGFLLLIPSFLLIASIGHVHTRFYLKFGNIFGYLGAVLVDMIFLLAYFCGRLVGLLKVLPRVKKI